MALGKEERMDCPICGEKMEEGGLLVDGRLVRWVPGKTFSGGFWRRLYFPKSKVVAGQMNPVLCQLRIPDACYCPRCNKVVGIFEVEQPEE